MPNVLKLLPEIASHPLAVVAYIIVALGWFVWLHHRRRSLDFLKAIKTLPDSEKGQFAQKAGYNYNELANLTRAQRVRLVMGQWFFLGYLATLLAVVLIAIAVISSDKRAVAAETLLRKIDAQREELQTELDKEKHRTSSLSDLRSDVASCRSVAASAAPSNRWPQSDR